MAILFDNPSKARSNPTILIKKDEDYNKLFPDSRNVHVYYNCMLIMKQTEEFLKTEFQKDDDDIAITKYYSLHLARIVASLFFKETQITEKILTNQKYINIEDDHFIEAVKFLKSTLFDYRKNNQQQDLVNISKSSAFSKSIITELKKNLPSLQRQHN